MTQRSVYAYPTPGSGNASSMNDDAIIIYHMIGDAVQLVYIFWIIHETFLRLLKVVALVDL